MAVSKGAHTFEAGFLYELDQLFKILLGFPRMADHQGCTQMDAGNFLPHPAYQGIRFFFRDVTAHFLQHRVTDMLKGDIHIFADIIAFAHHPEQIIREMGRIAIMQANPFHSRNIGDALHQFRQRMAFIQIQTIIGQILGDHLKFFHTLFHQQADFFLDFFHRYGLVTPRTDRNGAIRTGAVTPFGDLQVGIVPGSRQNTVGSQFPVVGFTQIVQQFFPIELSIETIDFR